MSSDSVKLSMACDARRKFDKLADSHPLKIFIEVGTFQADTFTASSHEKATTPTLLLSPGRRACSCSRKFLSNVQ